MHCPFCARNPSEISEYVAAAIYHEVSPESLIRMNEPTYHPVSNLFCCNDCYFERDQPFYTDLHKAFMKYRAKIIELRG